MGWIITVLPIGIFGFFTVLAMQLASGVALGGLGTYFVTVLAANFIQMLVVLPLLLLIRGINPLRVAKGMFPGAHGRFLFEVLCGDAARHDGVRRK
ncbi:MAG: cation:dicarboxylase symporter family transporter [Duodenibacillus massiliensis]